jgi:hypothetical protein
MGSYTENQKFYLIDGEELVNVEQDINYNLARADERVRPLVEYQITDEPQISSSSLPKDTGFKWYKTYTNAIYSYQANGGIAQDVNASVDTWSVSGISFETGYGSADQGVDRIAYSVYNNFVRFRGRLVLNGGTSDLPANVITDFMTVPNSILPTRNKYITCYGGNAGTDFQMFRIFIPNKTLPDGRIEFMKYGGNGSASTERYLSLNDVFYGLDD